MGLDMYLSRKTYVKNWKHNEKDSVPQWNVEIKHYGEKFDKIDVSKISYIEEELMYWRKANQIHKWFIDNCAEGIDDCREVYVPEDKLKELLQVCENVLIESNLVEGLVKNGSYASASTEWKMKDNIELGKVIKDYSYADEHLPTSGGFFFGSRDYDEYYYNQVLETLNFLKSIQNEEGEFEGKFYYRASW